MNHRIQKVSLYVRNHQTRKYELAKPKTYPMDTIFVLRYGTKWETLKGTLTYFEAAAKAAAKKMEILTGVQTEGSGEQDAISRRSGCADWRFCLLPAFSNPFGVGQGRSGVENPGEARMRAHRRDSSTWRTPSPIPAPRRLGIVRRCPRLWFPISCRGLANQRRVFASQDRIPSRPTNCSLHSLLCDPEHVSSLPQGCLHQPLRQGWSCTDEVFSNDRWLSR
jgi:hypothetical protein